MMNKMVTDGRFDALLERLERLAEKAERYLEPVPAKDTDFSTFLAYRWERSGKWGNIAPVEHLHHVDLDSLIGIDMAKEALVRNTRQYVAGLPANNVLLWGERGMGKSSCVKGLLPLFGAQGLRLVEVQRGDLHSFPQIVSILRRQPYRFIVFCDDLSFAEGDSSYQELKTLLDGGVEARPENLLIYATSNRRHLMPEPMEDNLRSEIHPEEAVSEKLSLADRFGITLSFYPFDQETYLAAVEKYACAASIDMGRDDLRKEALRWALYKGQRSGRAAKQFVDDLAGRTLLSA